ncbi:MAG: thiol peroxidase [Spirochaetia bacterium]
MAQVKSKGKVIHTVGSLPAVGNTAPDFTLTGSDLKDVALKDFASKKKLLNIVSSIDTSVCAESARRFDSESRMLSNTAVITVSADLPFAMKRFFESAGINTVIPLSQFRNPDFGRDYGVEITDGPRRGLLARAVIVLDENNKILYSQLVANMDNEPDYGKALEHAD